MISLKKTVEKRLSYYEMNEQDIMNCIAEYLKSHNYISEKQEVKQLLAKTPFAFEVIVEEARDE